MGGSHVVPDVFESLGEINCCFFFVLFFQGIEVCEN